MWSDCHCLPHICSDTGLTLHPGQTRHMNPVLTLPRQYTLSINYPSHKSTLHMGQLTVAVVGGLLLVFTHQSLLDHSGRTQHIYLQSKHTRRRFLSDLVIHCHHTHTHTTHTLHIGSNICTNISSLLAPCQQVIDSVLTAAPTEDADTWWWQVCSDWDCVTVERWRRAAEWGWQEGDQTDEKWEGQEVKGEWKFKHGIRKENIVENRWVQMDFFPLFQLDFNCVAPGENKLRLS